MQRSAHRGARNVDLALGYPEQREARLWIIPRLTRRPIRFLRFGVFAAKAMDLAALVQRSTWRFATPARLTIARAACVLQGGGPFTVRPSNFGAMEKRVIPPNGSKLTTASATDD